MRILSRALLAAAATCAAAMAGCSIGERPLVLHDDALRVALADQPSKYGRVAQWAHQFMTMSEAADMMQAQGYLCLGDTCRYQGKDFLLGHLEVKLEGQNGHLRRATGERWWSWGGGMGLQLGKVEAPGVQFPDAQSFTALMADWLRGRGKAARTQTHVPPWDGKPVTVGSYADTTTMLERLGFDCAFAIDAAEDVAKLRCHNRSFSGQDQVLWLTVATEDLALRGLEGQIGDGSVTIALTGPPDVAAGSARALVRDDPGKPWRVLVLDASAEAAQLAAAYARLDPPSRRRVLRALAPQVEARFGVDGDDALRPVLQQIEQAALDLRRLGTAAMSGGHEVARDASPKTYAAFMLAECDSLPLADARACFARYARARPELRALLDEAIAEAMPRELALAPDHPVSRRMKQLRALAAS